MARINGNAYSGELSIDLTDVAEHLVDLVAGTLKGARGEQPGLDEVLHELSWSMPAHGDAAEVHPAIYKRIVDSTAGINKLREKEAKLEKMLEVVRESRGRLENNREDDVSVLGGGVLTSAKRQGKPELEAPFEKTLKYRSQIAEKAAGTRRKRAKEKKADGE